MLAPADSVELWDFRYQRQAGDQFATAAEVAGRRNACEAEVRPPQIRFGRFEQRRGAMQMALALPTPFDVDALKDLALRAAQALYVLEAVPPHGRSSPSSEATPSSLELSSAAGLNGQELGTPAGRPSARPSPHVFRLAAWR